MKVSIVGMSSFVSKKGEEFTRLDCHSRYDDSKGVGFQCFNVITRSSDPRLPAFRKGIEDSKYVTAEIFFVGSNWRLPSAD